MFSNWLLPKTRLKPVIVALAVVGLSGGMLNVGLSGTMQTQIAEAATPIRINAGTSVTYTDGSGQDWSGDIGYQGGRAVGRPAVPIANSNDDALFRNERDGMTGYHFAAANGTYQVVLLFAEQATSVTGPGQRVFGLAVNDVLLGNLDVYAAAGGRDRAITRTASAAVTNGSLDVKFTPVSGEPMINALEILPISIQPPVNPVPASAAVPVLPTPVAKAPAASAPSNLPPVPAVTTAANQADQAPNPSTSAPTAVTPNAGTTSLDAGAAAMNTAPSPDPSLLANRVSVPAANPGVGLVGNGADVPFSTAAATDTSSCSVSLQSLIDATPAGSILSPPNCIYHERVTINKPMTLDGKSGANIRGSDVFSTFTASGATWVSQTAVPTFDMQNGQGICADTSTNACNWPEQVYLDGRPFTQVAAGTTPAAGQFALDAGRHVILVDNPSGHVIEVSTRTQWIDTESDNVTIQNFTFWHAANAAQTGAIGNQNHDNWTLRYSFLYDAHGGIVSLGGATNKYTETRVLQNSIGGSGYEGINGYMNTNTLIQSNKIFSNNLKAFDGSWSGGGVKVVAFTNVTMDNNEVYNNAGAGLWCDIGCNTANISNNRVHDNLGAQIMYEISANVNIYNNAVWNGFGTSPGVFIASSSGAEVYNNTIARVQLGVMVYDQNRGDKPSTGTVNDVVHDNKIVALSDPAMSVVWTDDGQGVITSAAYGDHGSNNSYYYSVPEDANVRFQWGSSEQFANISGFMTTPGGAGSSYLTGDQSNAALASAGIPAT